MFLGIEIGGTKLQLGVGPGDGSSFTAFARRPVDIAAGAAGILRQVEEAARELISVHSVRAIGYGFGGPIDRTLGTTRKSHQVAGWEDFPLAAWTAERFGLPVVMNNDCDAAALAEARFGAGVGRRVVLYVTVGTGVGGGLVIDGEIYTGSGSIAAEIGHLRPSVESVSPIDTVEIDAAGPAIAAWARFLAEESMYEDGDCLEDAIALEELCQDELERLTARDVALAAENGNQIALQAIDRAVKTLGWAIAQAITIVAPQVVVVGGGASLSGERLFFAPLRKYVECYVFPPLSGSYQILPAALGEEVVVHGALAAAAGPTG